MSKGHGKVERAILAALSRGGQLPWADTVMLAHFVYCCRHPASVNCPRLLTGYIPTRSQLESVRRALRNLRKQGLVLQTKYRHVFYACPKRERRMRALDEAKK
jgi:hypothetical protein